MLAVERHEPRDMERRWERPGQSLMTSTSSLFDDSYLSTGSDEGIEVMDSPREKIKDRYQRTLSVFGAPPELYNFYGDVAQCEFDITQTMCELQHHLAGGGINNGAGSKTPSLVLATDGHLAAGVLFSFEQKLIKLFNEWKSTVDKLVERQPSIPVFQVRLSEAENESEIFKVKAGCSMNTDEVALREGEDVFVTDTSKPDWMRVRNSSGDEGYVPALSCILPTPDANSLTAVERLHILLLTSWADCVRQMKALLESTLNHSIKQLMFGWNAYLSGHSYQGRIGMHLLKLCENVSARQTQTSTELVRMHRHLCRVESEVIEMGAHTNGLKNFQETLLNLDKAILCHQAFNKNFRHFRLELSRASRPIKLVEKWDQLCRARRRNNFKYYELKMTVDEYEHVEELTHIAPDSSTATKTGSKKKESVEADQITDTKQEERKRHLVRSVEDPRTGNKLSLKDAVAAGILVYRTGKYVNPDTGEGVPIVQAIKSGAISVDYTAVRRTHPVVDVTSVLTVKSLIVDDAYTVVGALDASTALRVPVAEAIERGIIDPTEEGGEFVNSITGARMPLDDAIKDGWVFAEFEGEAPRYSTASHMVLGVVDHGHANSPGMHRLTSGGAGGRMVSFKEAIKAGLLDPRTGDYVDSATGRRVYVAEAIRQGLVKTRLLSTDDVTGRGSPKLVPAALLETSSVF